MIVKKFLVNIIGPSAPDEISYEFDSICDDGDINNASITVQWNNTDDS